MRTNRRIGRHRSVAVARVQSAPRRRAFTIVELVIVLMVMSIMAAVAAPTFYDSLLHHQVESAARRVKADLELVRNTARLTSSTQSLTFTGTRYTLSAGAVGLDDPDATYAVDLAAAPYEVQSVTASFNNTPAISFNGHGMPSSDGVVVLRCQRHQATISLNGATGDVVITSEQLLTGVGHMAVN